MLGVVAVKLLIEDLYKIRPIASLAIVLGLFVIGISRRSCADKREGGGGAPPGASAQLGELTRDLGLDVQRLAARPCAARVARDHEVAHLGLQRRVATSGRQQRGELGLDVEQRAPGAPADGVAGAEQLAQLGLLLGPGRRAAQASGSRSGRSVPSRSDSRPLPISS